jgi:cytidylate kinase
LLIIAIDGPSASGKGTVAKIIAEHFKISHLDTGLLYRAVAFNTMKTYKTVSVEKALKVVANLSEEDLQNSKLRLQKYSDLASELAKEELVRNSLIGFQRNFPRQTNGAVLDGRDIGSVIFPKAQVKLFVTADISVRALRRQEELIKIGQNISLKEVKERLIIRDERDRNREFSPLVCPRDATVIDTSLIPFGDLKKEIIEIVEKKYKSLSLGSSE